MRRTWRGPLVLACLVAVGAVVAYPWLPRPGQTVVNTGVGLAAVAAILVGVRRYRPVRRVAWLLFAAGLLAWVLGDLIYDLIGYAAGQAPPVSVADLFYLAMYPLLIGGALAAGRPWADRAAGLDAAIVAGGCWLLIWETALKPQLIGAGPLTAGTLLAAAYPALDVVLLGAVVGLLLVPARTATHALVAAGLGLLLVADTVYAELAAHGSYHPGATLDLVWLASYLLWIPAALHPSMRTLGLPTPAGGPRVSRLRLAVLAGAALTIPLCAALDDGAGVDGWRIGAGTLLVLLIMARLVMLVRRHETAALADPLTGLPNRAALLDTLHAAVRTLDPARGGLAVLYCDLDDFTLVNDTLGAVAGDRLLRAVGARLRDLVRPADLVARFGGDEFVVVGRDVTAAEAETLAARLTAGCGAPIRLADAGEVTVGLSIGLVHCGDPRAQPVELVQNADAALHEGKSRGRARIQPFTGDIRARAHSRLDLERALRAALRNDELHLHYQPQVDLRTGAVTGLEALARWTRPGHGPVPPARFIPAAEAAGLVVPLGGWVIAEAARQIARWDAELDRPAPPVAVNVSPRLFAATDVADLFAAAAADADIEPGRLAVEITEGALEADRDDVLRALTRLKRLGVDIAIDDFGTGYSSLSHLRLLPIDDLKIDQSFVRGVATSRRDRDLVTAIVQMARALELRTIAEGVETADQAAALLALGCGIGQGFLFATPAPAPAVLAYLRTRQRHTRLALVDSTTGIPAPRTRRQ